MENMDLKGKIRLFELVNDFGARVVISNLGAGINRIIVPDRNGKLDDVVLGYQNDCDYLDDSPCAGKTPGRFANRIYRGKFRIDDTEYQLSVNDGQNHLHGGMRGFQNRIWETVEASGRRVVLGIESLSGEEGYPGTVSGKVTYEWGDDCSLRIGYDFTTDSPTILNLTNHAYFNLRGADSGCCLDHVLQIDSERRVQSDSRDIPTGHILPVEGTPMDFRRPKALGVDMGADFENLRSGKGYNHYFFRRGYEENGKELRHVATLYDDISGRRLDVETTYPGLMLYTGNWLEGSPENRSGRPYNDHDGVAMECQLPPDAPNHSNFPNAILRPEEIYRHLIVYKFSYR